MARFTDTPNFEHGRARPIGIVLCNLGTPSAATASAVRRYLAEFLSDPRVVEIPRVIWWLILHGIVLRVRPRRSAQAYAKIWRDDGSPLLAIGRQQAQAISKILDSRYPNRCQVVLAMRYGEPSIAQGLDELQRANVRQILVLPMYPQYAGATTGSVMDAFGARLKRWRWVPSFRFVSDYHDDPNYIAALAQSLKDYWQRHGRGEHLLMSFHGLPQRTFLAGDPYHCQCLASARLLAAELQLEDDAWSVSFQSRFGRAQWLQPYTESRLRELAAAGTKNVDVICPGFAADCLETLEEIAMQYAAVFKDCGGKALNYVPALNDSPAHVDALVSLIEENLKGWPQVAADFSSDADLERRQAAATRAKAMMHE